jgi:bifunctional DNase/RNase
VTKWFQNVLIFPRTVLRFTTMSQKWTEVSVRGVVIDPMTGEPAILLEDSAETAIISVPADPGAAGSIISELEGMHRDAPHSLLYRFFVRHGIQATHVELARNSRGELAAALRYCHEGQVFRMEVRPVDGIAIGILAAAPLFASTALINEHLHSSHAPRVMDNSDLLILSRVPPRRSNPR